MPALVTIDLDDLVLLKADARGFSLLPRQPVASLLSGRYTSRLRGRGLAFEELRHYQQGDDIRTMDWRATARLRSPHVRVFSEERERPVLLVTDQRTPMFFGSRRAMKSVAAAETTALAAWAALRAGDRVGGMVFNEREIIDLPPHRSQSNVLRLLHEVSRMNHELAASPPPAGKVTIDDALEAALRRAKHDHLVVIISDLDGAGPQTESLATRLAAHNDVIVIAIYDPLGASLQARPGMIAATPQGHLALHPSGAFATAFQQAFAERLDDWQQIFRKLRVPVLPISTATPPAAQLRDLFGQHLK
jgi:uncharacterized protein (DUF58 family)